MSIFRMSAIVILEAGSWLSVRHYIYLFCLNFLRVACEDRGLSNQGHLNPTDGLQCIIFKIIAHVSFRLILLLMRFSSILSAFFNNLYPTRVCLLRGVIPLFTLIWFSVHFSCFRSSFLRFNLHFQVFIHFFSSLCLYFDSLFAMLFFHSITSLHPLYELPLRCSICRSFCSVIDLVVSRVSNSAALELNDGTCIWWLAPGFPFTCQRTHKLWPLYSSSFPPWL